MSRGPAKIGPSMVPVYSALILVQVLFGISYVLSKIVVGALSPILWASIRLTASAALMLAAAYAFNRSRPKITASFLWGLLPLALFGMIINQGSFLLGLSLTTAVNSAILNTLIPVFTLAITLARGEEKLTRYRACGFALSFFGVLLLTRIEEASFSSATLRGDLLTVLNSLSYSFFLVLGRKRMQHAEPLWTTAWLFALGAGGMGLIAAPLWVSPVLPPFSALLMGCMIYAVIGGTLLPYSLNLWALKKVRSSSVALFVYLQPVVTALIGWLWLGQAVTPRAAFSAALIFTGVGLTTIQPGRRFRDRLGPKASSFQARPTGP